MAQNKKYFGMTSMQAGIVLALGALACLLIAAVGWMMFGGSVQLPFSRGPESTPTPNWTPTVYMLPTLTPTVTPTPIPYEQLIPNGWKQFKTDLVEIWLPPSFKEFKKESEEELSLEGETSKDSLYRIRVLVYFKPLVGDSLDAFLDDEFAKMDSQVRITERKKVTLNATDAMRVMLEMRVDGVDVNELIYIVQDGNTVWLFGYVAQINEFYEMLPLFEQSAKTFRVVR